MTKPVLSCRMARQADMKETASPAYRTSCLVRSQLKIHEIPWGPIRPRQHQICCGIIKHFLFRIPPVEVAASRSPPSSMADGGKKEVVYQERLPKKRCSMVSFNCSRSNTKKPSRQLLNFGSRLKAMIFASKRR